MGIISVLQHGWNAFTKRSSSNVYVHSSSSRPDRSSLRYNVDRTIVSAIYNRIAVDASGIAIRHVRLDENGRFSEVINSKLNDRLTHNANKDQTGRDLIKDAVISLCDEGCIALVPTHTDTDPDLTGSFTIDALRVGKILEWYPNSVCVEVYNENRGQKEQIIVDKSYTAIVENPFYEIMNCPNSTLQRLIQKLNLLDKMDNEAGAGKLDIIIQLPYAIRNSLKREQAEQRRKDIEMQLVGSKYGIAYIDATEHITQLNRPAENTLLEQVQELTNTVYNQIGLSQAIMNQTAGEQEQINYFNSTIEPFLSAIASAIEWKFISKTARTQGQAIYYYRDPFKLVPSEKLAEVADKFTRNEILSPNEIRAIIGYKPSSDPKSDELRNRNLNQNNSDVNDAEDKKIKEDGIKISRWDLEHNKK